MKWIFLALAAVSLFFCLLFYFRPLKPEAAVASPALVNCPSGTPSTLPTPAKPTVTRLESNIWEIILPANQIPQLPVVVKKGQQFMVLSRSGVVKLNACNTFVSPPEGAMPVFEIINAPEDYTLQNGWVGALLGKLKTESGEVYFDIGGRNGDVYDIPADGQLFFTINCRKNEVLHASGSFHLTLSLD